MKAAMDIAGFKSFVEEHERTRPSVNVEIEGVALRYLTPNGRCLWRVQTLASKEPVTLQWLNRIPNDACLLDIGANVRMYSIYAGVVRKARVFAFEPEAQNYAVLCGNIRLNGLSDRVIAWSAALSDETKFDKIYLSDGDIGGSCHTFGAALDANLEPANHPFTQGCFATTVDALVADGAIEMPQFIKIDVDGLEHKVIKGAAATLKDSRVHSVIIEINSNLGEHRAVIDHLETLGFRHDPRQFQDAQRKDGLFKGVGEYVFER